MEKPLQTAGVAPQVGGARSQGTTRAGQWVWARLMETQIWHLTIGFVGEELREETMASASSLVWEKAFHLALSLMLDTLATVCPWWLSSCCPSAGVQRKSFRVSSCAGFLSGSAWDSRSPSSHSAIMPAVLYSLKLWGLLFLVLESLAGGPGVRLGSLISPKGPPHLWYPSQFLAATWTSPFVSSLLLPVLKWFLFYIFSCMTSVQLDFRQFWWWLLCRLVVFLMWAYEDVSTIFTYATILIGRLRPGMTCHLFLSLNKISWF